MDEMTLIHGDCLKEMKKMPDKSVDLVLTDPPYGIGIASKGTVGGGKLAKVTNYGNQEWDNKIPNKDYFNEMFRISKNQIIFGGNYFVEYLYNSPCWIVWNKERSDANFADCELAWTSFKSPTKKVRFKWDGMLQGNMKEKEKRYHPTQKPVSIMAWILRKYSKENDLICDPFFGSCPVGIACKELNRRFIGIEINKEYYDIAQKRIANTQRSMF